jgi:hypothetical protein
MKKRYLYTLLCLLPGVLFALIASMFVTGATAGFFWIFIFGDNSWPQLAEKGLVVIMAATFIVVWVVFLVFGFLTGKRLEADPVLDKKHILASVVLTFLPLLIIVLHQLSVGNIGPPHDSVLCGDYCLEQGYSSSERPPQDSGDDRCICLDKGVEVLSVPMETLRSAR